VTICKRIDASAPSPAVIRLALSALADGGIVAYPTDTFYGLAVDPRMGEAVARLFDVKGRAPGLALPLIAADLEQVEHGLGRLSARERALAAGCWPGPLTMVIGTQAPLAPPVRAADGSVAVRVPDEAVARALARALGFPITATSANRSGSPPSATADEVARALGGTLSVILDAGATRGGSPSTIVRLDESGPRLLRPGAVPFARVLELLQ
jgi:L-threonylcarbamoyladenylate synthase